MDWDEVDQQEAFAEYVENNKKLKYWPKKKRKKYIKKSMREQIEHEQRVGHTKTITGDCPDWIY